MSVYSYQKPLVENAYAALLKGKPVVLAGCPGAGKTRMALDLVTEYFFKDFPGEKALIMTHGQLLLRSQWDLIVEGQLAGDSLTHGVIRTKSEANAEIAGHDIILSIPQTVRNAKIDRVKLLVVDEAHQRYFSKEMEDIIKELKPEFILLLTGTPSVFLNNSEYFVLGITIEELLDLPGVMTDPVIEIVQTDYLYDLDDYDQRSFKLKSRALPAEATYKTLDMMLPQLMLKLTHADRANPEKYDMWGYQISEASWPHVSAALRKTMFACNNQAQAIAVKNYFDKHHVKAILSISKENDGAIELVEFMADDSVPIFIVVHRGTLGFNYVELMNVVDLTGTLNPNRIFQLLCRIVRPSALHPETKKLYIKGTTQAMAELTYFAMSFTVGLSTKKHYYSYSTKPKNWEAEVDPEFIEHMERTKNTNVYTRTQMPALPKVFSFSDLKERMNGIGSIAHTDFYTVINRVYGRKERWTVERAVKHAILCPSRKAFELTYPGAYAYLLGQKKLDLLDTVYGKKFRWNEDNVHDKLLGCPTLSDFRMLHPGAYNWVKRHKRFDLLQARYGYEIIKKFLKPHDGTRYIMNNRLDAERVDLIRHQYLNEGATYADLMKEHNCCKSHISDIINEKIWKPVH